MNQKTLREIAAETFDDLLSTILAQWAIVATGIYAARELGMPWRSGHAFWWETLMLAVVTIVASTVVKRS